MDLGAWAEEKYVIPGSEPNRDDKDASGKE
jgi:endogenous inhibitor of DNA gyrase (YacG/DUF329 family)